MIPRLMDNTKTLTALVTDNTSAAILSDCLSCEVHEKANGEYTVELTFPAVPENEINVDDILKIKANPYDDLQLFRVYKVVKDLDSTTVNANHITYDLKKTSVAPCSASSAIEALNTVKKNMTGGDDFTLQSTLTTEAKFTNTIPQSARALMGGQDGSLLDVYGGYYYWDNLTVTLGNRGDDNGVTIAYGKNLTSIEQETDNESQYTHVVPYATKDDVTTIGDMITLVENANPVKIRNLDLSEKFDEEDEITKETLKTKAESYIKSNDMTDISVSISLDYDNLQKYGTEFMEEVKLCDKVHVHYTRLGVNGTARVTEYTYDALKEEYTSMEIGSVRASLSSSISSKISSETTSLKDASNAVKAQIDLFSNIIANGLGLFETKETQPDGSIKIYLHNKKTIAESSVVYTMNADGFAISQDHGKTWSAGIDSEGNAVVNALSANIIKSLQIYGSYIEGATIKGGTFEGGTTENGTIKAATVEGTTIKGGEINGTTITGVSGDFTDLEGDNVNMNNSITFFKGKDGETTLKNETVLSPSYEDKSGFVIEASASLGIKADNILNIRCKDKNDDTIEASLLLYNGTFYAISVKKTSDGIYRSFSSPLNITYRNLDNSDSLGLSIRKDGEYLAFYDSNTDDEYLGYIKLSK